MGVGVNSRKFFLCLVAVGFGILDVAHSTEPLGDRCAGLMGDLMGEAAGVLSEGDSQSEAELRRYLLSDLLVPGDESLIKKHPWIIMNSAQRLLHMIYKAGVREIPDRRLGYGTRKRYAFFSDAIDLTGGAFVVGHLEGIEAIVAQVEATADGQPTKDHVAMLMGPPGTGKSHVLTLKRRGLLNATQKLPEYFAFTFEWVDLSEIPGLRGRLPEACTRAEHPEPFADPINDSPFAVLPEAVQNRLLAKYDEDVRSLIGRAPMPKRELSPKSHFIRSKIFEYYANQKGKPLTLQEMVEALNRHVRIKRLVLGRDNTAPYLANQGKEPNLPRLFGKNNPIVQAEFGNNDPFAVHEGVIAMANGGVVFFDEIMKNELSFLGKLLNLFSSHIVEVAPGVLVPADLVFLAASNLHEEEELRSKDPQSPLLSRKNDIPWPYVIYPDEVGRVLVMEIANLRARELGTGASADFVDIQGRDVFKLFPEVEPYQPVVTPHGRYSLVIGGAQNGEISLAPHAIEFITNVITLTRLNFDRAKVRFGDKYPIVTANDGIFGDPITRLRVLLGQKKVSEAQLQDLHTISQLSKEGYFGMDHRDVERWWQATVTESQNSVHQNTVTPLLLYEVLKKRITSEKMLKGDQGAQKRAALFADIVFSEFVLPAIKEDLNLAFARSEGRDVMDQVYEEIIQELYALGTDPEAEFYTAQPSNERRRIDRARLDKIRRIYQEKQGRPLSPQEISTWVGFTGRVSTPERARLKNPQLLSAIAAYQTEVVLQKERTTIKRLLDVADGTAVSATTSETARARSLMEILQNELGYNLHAAKVAIDLLINVEANRERGGRN